MEKMLILGGQKEILALLGQNDQNLRFMANLFNTVKLIPRGNELIINGPDHDVENAYNAVFYLMEMVKEGNTVQESDVSFAFKKIMRDFTRNSDYTSHEIHTQRKTIKPKTASQKDYLAAIKKNDITFSIGPAGTGKTYLAMAMAVYSLFARNVQRIILTRPVVEAGEKLGFLPGDIYAKVDPYFRPLYDAFYEMIDVEKLNNYIEKGIVEIAPLAYMRGRTLNDSFIILDEAQNTTREQMKMFLTRLGFGSKAVITGDITQIDLKNENESGLVQIQDILKGIEGISFSYFTQADVVRHEIVQKIIQAYEKYNLNLKKADVKK